MFVSPHPNSLVEALTTKCDGIWGWGLWRSGGWGPSDVISALVKRDSRELALSPAMRTKKRLCEHTARWQLPLI